MKQYVVIGPLKLGAEAVAVGSVVSLDPKQAEWLVRDGFVRPATAEEIAQADKEVKAAAKAAAK